MGGYYLSKRSLKNKLTLNATYRDGTKSSVVQDSLGNSYQGQVTYSFRSTVKGDKDISQDSLPPTLEQIMDQFTEPKKGVLKDSGHNFYTQKSTIKTNWPNVYLVGAGGSVFRGPLQPTTWPSGSTPSSAPVVIPDINTAYYGPKAILATVPTSPSASLANALIELKRDGLPKPVFGDTFRGMKDSWTTNLSSTATTIHALRALSGDYLNWMFGIVPLLSDIKSLLESVVNSEKILTQYMRDSGRLVRRRYHFPKLESTQTFAAIGSIGLSDMSNTKAFDLFKGWNPASPSSTPSGAFASTSCTVKTTETYSFSGAYTYFLDQGDSILDKAAYYSELANKLLGVKLTPDVLWNAAPWSWLVDWYANVGTNISVASRFADPATNLVMPWGYLMRRTVVERTATTTGIEFQTLRPGPIRVSHITVRKERVKATPFGFGSSSAGWTDRQWAILASLGMTRAPKTAW